MTIAIQVKTEHTSSHKLGGVILGFGPYPDLPGISGALINPAQLERMQGALRTIPHRIDHTGNGCYQAFNGANWYTDAELREAAARHQAPSIDPASVFYAVCNDILGYTPLGHLMPNGTADFDEFHRRYCAAVGQV